MVIILNNKEIDFLEIKKLIKKGNIIIYPTDTVYGVGGSIDSEQALRKIYSAKSRMYTSPLIALVSERDIINKIAKIPKINEEKFKVLTDKFWPGGLTIILERLPNVPDIMVSNGNTVGLRMPNHEIALKVIEAAGGLLPTTSANISGESTPRSYDELSEEFISRVDIAIDGGKCPVGTESTIIDLTNEKIKILRVGAISQVEIEAIIGKI